MSKISIKDAGGSFEAHVEGPRRVRAEIVVTQGAGFSIAWVCQARDAERMGRALLGAAKASRKTGGVKRALRSLLKGGRP